MKTWVEWIEPFGPNNEVVYLRVEASTAIAMQRHTARLAKPGFEYESDQAALVDFVAVHWAEIWEE